MRFGRLTITRLLHSVGFEADCWSIAIAAISLSAPLEDYGVYLARFSQLAAYGNTSDGFSRSGATEWVERLVVTRGVAHQRSRLDNLTRQALSPATTRHCRDRALCHGFGVVSNQLSFTTSLVLRV